MILFSTSCDTECTVWMNLYLFAGDFFTSCKVMLPVPHPNYTPVS